jgi:type I restriction enzyme S subunit
MDAQQFLAEFGHIANAPGGVGKLRELILDLAIRGKLLTASDHASDAQVLLSEISKFRAELVHAGKLRRPTPQPEIQDAELVFSLPKGWAFERLGNVCEIVRGVTFPSSKKQTSQTTGSVACLRTSNVQAEIDWDDLIFIDDEFVGREDQWVQKGDTMISMANSYELVGKVALVREVKQRATFGGFIAAVRPHVLEPDYLYLLLRSPYMQTRMRATASQTTNIANISLGGMRPIPTPIPPKEEQSRIVAKVDELMALCDTLEAQQQARRKLQNALRQSTLQAVANSQSPHELQTTWKRLADNFGRLFHAPEDVAQIKGLIFDLAIQGLLAERRLNDEPAEKLIARSLEAKRVRLASGEMKNKKPSATDIVDVEINIPAHWKKASLDELFQFIDYRGKTPTKTSSGVVLVTAKNVRPGFISNEPVEFLSESSYQAWMTRGFPRIGDLLITTEAPLGNVARIEEQPSFALAQRVIDLQPFADINTKCAMYFMMSPLFQSLLDENSTGMTAKGIKAGKLKQLLLPVPPAEEQQRIVQRVEDLMKMCSVLSLRFEAARKQSARLAAAVISNFTGTTIDQEEEPMKAPQTELIAPLRSGTAPDIKAQAPLATILARHNGEMSAKDLWQRFGGEIDAFYAQLKTEVAHGWILEPAPAEMRTKQADTVSA